MFENLLAVVQIYQSQPLVIQMRAIASLATGQMGGRGVEFFLQKSYAGDGAAFPNVERLAGGFKVGCVCGDGGRLTGCCCLARCGVGEGMGRGVGEGIGCGRGKQGLGGWSE